MTKCKECGQIAEYTVKTGKQPSTVYCETHMINIICNTNKTFTVNKLGHVEDKGQYSGSGGFKGQIRDIRA